MHPRSLELSRPNSLTARHSAHTSVCGSVTRDSGIVALVGRIYRNGRVFPQR